MTSAISPTKIGVAVMAVLVVLLAWWYREYRYDTYLVPGAADGSVVSLACSAARAVEVVTARYTSAAGSADVAAALQSALDAAQPAAGEPVRLAVSGPALGQPAGGTLAFRYRCRALRAGFAPAPVPPCAGPGWRYDGAGAPAGRDAAGTVAWEPYSTVSRISLERHAETPEVAHGALNPYTGLGKTSLVRALGDRYRHRAASVYELQPGEPGFLEETGDGAMSLHHPGVDSDFITDGPYGEAALRETLTSRRRAQPNTLTASGTGLGSVRRDPRFEPGPQRRVPGGDASWGHGGHAGGPTSGGYGSSRFAPGAAWAPAYVFGFGDRDASGRAQPAEALDTDAWALGAGA